ncbi:hypothetical protein NDN11_10180 [Acinetobacter sp. C26M]|uniref:hypothetical protein n=1 Tax=unclassified Acinetobacter TaxID=196816 RepID=UPI0020372506|nr:MULTISPECIES: hypothetical protein [unclassified Acinetobacter]USA45102.1 hypothetical protein NDN11_10180 [Acinetobacter sp. C26M]USA48604.1 hypothetical protein NDN12_10180 [Acinetobacter sp. C26G]
MYINLRNQLVKSTFLFFMTLSLAACGKVAHEPKVGEYGESLVNSVLLTSSEIDALNKAVIEKPKDTFKRPNIGISFQADPSKNPYRFVIVAKGTAQQQGKVELKWIGGVQSESSNGYHPEVFQSDDKHSYDLNQPLLLVISSDPFSVSEQNNGMNYGVHAELTEATNIQFQSVEVQVWQGKGSQYNWTSYLKFLVILMVAIFGIYRLVSR